MSAALATPPNPSARARWFNLALLTAAGAAVALTDIWTCPFALVTGLPCPGCGITRACLALVAGDLPRALALHPLSPVVLPTVSVLGTEVLFSYVSLRPATWSSRVLQKLRLEPDWLWLGAAAALIAVWLARFCGAFGGPVSVTRFGQ